MQAERPLQEVNSHSEVNSCDIAAALLVRKWCANIWASKCVGACFWVGEKTRNFRNVFLFIYLHFGLVRQFQIHRVHSFEPLFKWGIDSRGGRAQWCTGEYKKGNITK